MSSLRSEKAKKIYYNPPNMTAIARKDMKTSELSLSNLQAKLPLELIYEVLGYLTPRDLLRLSRLIKSYRITLMSKDSARVWRTSLKDVDAPACPHYLSLPTWADLLLGDPFCHVCERKVESQSVVSDLARRICQRCLNGRLMTEAEINDEYPRTCNILKIIAPHTYRPLSEEQKLWIGTDINKLSQKVAQYEAPEQEPSSQSSLEAFVAEQSARASAFKQGGLELARALRSFHKIAIYGRTREIANRLISRGWDKENVFELCLIRLRDWPATDDVNVLTECEWTRLQSWLETCVEVVAAEHAEDTRIKAVMRREHIAHEVYRSYLQTRPASEWIRLPRLRLFADQFLDPFKRLINANPKRDISKADFEAGIPEFRFSVIVWRQGMLKKLNAMLPRSMHKVFRPHDQDPERRLSLAVMTFFCKSTWCYSWVNDGPRPCIGWEACINHKCQQRRDLRQNSHTASGYCFEIVEWLRFCPPGAEAVESILPLLGLDRQEARPCDLDRACALFSCNNCQDSSGDEEQEHNKKNVYTWRQCVIHYIHPRTYATHQPPSWTLLAPEQASSARDVIDKESGWACNHCADHLISKGTRISVIEHNQEKHGIESPAINDDYVYCHSC